MQSEVIRMKMAYLEQLRNLHDGVQSHDGRTVINKRIELVCNSIETDLELQSKISVGDLSMNIVCDPKAVADLVICQMNKAMRARG